MTNDKAQTTRDQILRAAERVVMREGVAGMTIAAVAKEAGLSKGGVLYHYASKEALVQGMLERLIALFEADVEHYAAGDATRAPGRYTRAYVRATLEPRGESASSEVEDVSAAIIAAVSTDPTLLEPLEQRFRAWQEAIEADDVDPVYGTIARLAADGLWLTELFDFYPPEGELRDRVVAEIVALTRKRKRGD
jgi:AcrR family transcriptional regulator